MTTTVSEHATKDEGAHEEKSAHSLPTNAHQKPVLILINPHSGRGKSLKIFRKQVEQILNTHHVAHEVFVTTRDIRIREFLDSKTSDQLASYKSIFVVSGDGLLHETVNAFMARDDWQEAIKIPIGLIPTGSGNGLAHTLIKLSRASPKNHREAVKLCCEQAVQSGSCSSDLVRITYGQNITVWSFLSIGWGLLADIDIDSEWLRCIGEFRFTLYGVFKALRSACHRGRLSYKIAPEHRVELSAKLCQESNANASMYTTDTTIDTTSYGEDSSDNQGQEWIHIEDRFACLYAVHQPYVNSNTNFSPKSTLTDQLTYLTYIRGRLSMSQAIKFLLAIEDGSHGKLPFVKVVPVRVFKFQPLERSKVVVDGEKIPYDISQGPLTARVVPEILNLAWSALT